MLTTPTPVPPNSASPLPSNWGQQNAASLYYLFSAGLTQEPTVACAPGPAAFAVLAPAGTLFPFVTPNSDPALSTAVLAPSAVSPLASQVYQVQQSQRQGLVGGQNGTLGQSLDLFGQTGAGSSSDDWSGAAEVYPMNTTANMVTERTPLAQRVRRRGPPRNAQSPGVPWGGAAVNVPQGGCSSGMSGWGKLFLLAGALAIASAALASK